MMTDLSTFVEFAETLADEARKVSLRHFRSPSELEDKSAGVNFDPVTLADKVTEHAIRTLIAEHYPEHGIMGEEFGTKEGNEYQWLIDPIDGTRAFISGMPSWSILLAFAHNGQPLIGLFDQPYIGERMIGVKGKPTIWKEQMRMQTREREAQCRLCADISDAVLATTDHRFFVNQAGEAEMVDLLTKAKLMRYGGDGYNYAMLALGQIDAVIEQDLKPHDIQPFIPIITGAGGRITDWRGEPPTGGGQIIASGDARLHTQLITMFSQAAI